MTKTVRLTAPPRFGTLCLSKYAAMRLRYRVSGMLEGLTVKRQPLSILEFHFALLASNMLVTLLKREERRLTT